MGPGSEERYDREMMLDNGVYYSIISDSGQEPYCSQFDPEKRENILQLIDEYREDNP